jgi:hypothetical protein
MNSPHNFKRIFLPYWVLVLIFLLPPFIVSAQDKPGQENSGNKKTVKVQVITDENGKVTKFDTTYTTEGGKDISYEYQLRGLEDNMKDLEEQMKELEVVISDNDLGDLDSIAGIADSLSKHIIIRTVPRVHMRAMPHARMYMGEPWCLSQEPEWNDDEGNTFRFNQPVLPPQWQSLLGSIPLGNITGFKVIDKKGGKRIIIDMDDNPVIMTMPSQRGHARTPHKIIIEKNIQSPPPPPAPPAPDTPKDQNIKKG